jgi:hypothetical protein
MPINATGLARCSKNGTFVDGAATMLPFTLDQFLSVFSAYNAAIWPAQIAAYALGAVAVAALFRPGRTADRIISAILALMWLWTGAMYHGLFFAGINKAAFGFAALFIVQGVAFLYLGVIRDGLSFGIRPGLPAIVGWVFIAYAAILYPLIGVLTGHGWPAMPMFGVTPCPVTIFTFGLLLLSIRRFSYWLLAIPFVWSLIGGSAAILLDVPQDWLLLASGIITVGLILLRDRHAAVAA